ncbi:MAG: DUF2813 domain-containing protein [Planctomycetota bacterium]|nr:MAG: DUF2813 domain-containing protein [Planctomycetota bacterium]
MVQLERLEVAGFRGLRLAVELSHTTLFIGESRAGKSTVLEVLERCLGVRATPEAPFLADDFRSGAIEVVLEFSCERAEGALEELAWRRRRRDHVALRVRAEPGKRACWAFVDADRQVVIEPAPEPLRDRLRALHPVLLLSSDRFLAAGRGADDPPSRRGRDELFARVFLRRGALATGELEEGFEALRKLLAEDAPRPEQGKSTRRMMREIVDAPGRMRALRGGDGVDLRSAGAQSLALFLLVSWLLEVRGGQAIEEGAEAILAIEEPELHLHPIVVASLWGLLELLPAQKLITTNSPALLGAAPLHSLRRLRREDGLVRVYGLRKGAFDLDELRRVGFHLRLERSASLFARCWLLVEGESEVWLLPELARLCGVVFPSEGIECISFAQCGLVPIVRLADALGIAWHLLADGDEAGGYYARLAREQLDGRPEAERITRLDRRDIEHFMWHNGYEELYRAAARGKPRPGERRKERRRRRRRGSGRDPTAVIRRALHKSSKPEMALRVAIAAANPDGPGVPPLLRELVARTAALARAQAGGYGEELSESVKGAQGRSG